MAIRHGKMLRFPSYKGKTNKNHIEVPVDYNEIGLHSEIE